MSNRGRSSGRGGGLGGGGGGFRGRGGPSGDHGGRGSGRSGGGGYSGHGGEGGYSDRGGSRGRGFDDRGGGRRHDRSGVGGRGRGGSRDGGVFNPGPNVPSDIDTRLIDNSEDDLIASLRRLRLDDYNHKPSRPNYGVLGNEIKLRTNFFPTTIPDVNLYQYDINIDPSQGIASRRAKRRIWQLAEQLPDWKQKGLSGRVAHDHSTKLIAAVELELPLVLSVPFYDEDETGPPATGGKTYTLTFRLVSTLTTAEALSYVNGNQQYRDYDLSPILSALNIVLYAYAARSGTRSVEVGRNKFFFPNVTKDNLDLGGGLEAWKGFYTSLRPAWKRFHVNVNVCTTAFYKHGNLAVRMEEYHNSTFGAKFDTFVRGLRVKTSHLHFSQQKTIKRVSRLNARTHRFDSTEFGKVSVEQYFQKKYSIVLGYPNLPLVDVGGQKRDEILLPPEICIILPNQAYKGKLTDDHTKEMILIAAKPANINAGFITGPGLQLLGFRDTADPLPAFGLDIGPNMAIVPGRILPRPSIKYAHSYPLAPVRKPDDRASWNMRGATFHKGAKLERWAVMIIKDNNPKDFQNVNDPELLAIIKGFSQMCATSGMLVDQTPPPRFFANLPRKNQQQPTRHDAIEAIRDAVFGLKEKQIPKPKIMLVVLSNGDKHIYSGLKSLCDSYLGIGTVCVHSSKIRKEIGQPQYFANVALKFNVKLGGINHVLDQQSMSWLSKAPTMIVGMDVTHPSPGSVKYTPSIAAVVASVDQDFGQFPASLSLQKSKQEMIEKLDKLMHERFEDYRSVNAGKLPERIVIYRDGVSEGQFDTVLEQELPLIHKSFEKYNEPNAPYKPTVTIVVCGKRHHTRFFPTDRNDADERGNPKAGTVVDRGVTAIYDFDFFLQAHGSLHGTTRPCHYYVVWDENDFNADTIQAVTHEISYLFARATKAVSLCSPAYYADIACERGRCYLHRLLQGFSTGGGTNTSGSQIDNAKAKEEEDRVMKEAEAAWHNGVHPDLKRTMFYL